ncbi:MAG TPA: hypothetical protein VMW42_04300 [Desulfatiglandales bacterium]|nr:hypothetical protein [Desulfatiglandales bacterium]
MTERKKEGIFSKIFGGEKPSCCNVRIEEVTKKEEEGTTVSAPSPADPSVQCGPECACNAPSGGKGIKIMVSLLVLLAVAGVLTFKAWNGRRAASNDTGAEKASVFSVAQTVSEATPKVATKPSVGMGEKKTVDNAASGISAFKTSDGEPTVVQPKTQDAAEKKPPKATVKIGEYMESLSDLNKVALSQDAVFIFIPRAKDEAVQSEANEAVVAAQQSLKRSNIKVGLYTLSTNSPDYTGIEKQVQTPAILVVTKGRGMAAVSGELTETKLLQTFIATSRAGGCGPSSCSPSSGVCN